MEPVWRRLGEICDVACDSVASPVSVQVEVSEFPSVEFGLRLTENVHEEEKVIVVPERLIMSLETASQGPLGKLIASESLLKAMPNLALALHLLNERSSPNSFWKPYIGELSAVSVHDMMCLS